MQSVQEAFPSEIDLVLSELRAAIAQHLTPQVRQIDVDGEYPKAFMHCVGALGGFRQACPVELDGSGVGIKGTIQVMEEIAQSCLSTGFITWSQTVCIWYVQNSQNAYLKQQFLPGMLSGQLLAGTAFSNPMKHFADIENIYLTARRCTGGYSVSGTVPWVSNVDTDHIFAIVAKVAETDTYLAALVPADAEQLTLGNGGHFIALEGSNTRSCLFKDVFIPDEYILANPCNDYIKRIQPGFILSQTGFGLGLINSCIALMNRSNISKGHVNRFLDDQVTDIEADLQSVRQSIYHLADEIGCGEQALRADIMKDVIHARIVISELSLRASQATMLHLGASGYRLHSMADRKLRESYFVAIVTPALKHLKKLQYELQ
ncbi:MAG TPA: acyl-CoA dehydrogenase family protein [Ktedonobacteraceae bacterium]